LCDYVCEEDICKVEIVILLTHIIPYNEPSNLPSSEAIDAHAAARPRERLKRGRPEKGGCPPIFQGYRWYTLI